MQLVVHGRIVRSEGGQISIRMVQHEFRTAGMPANHGVTPSKTVRTHTPFLAAINGTASLGKIQ
jgi:hypothetical protein